MLEGGCHCGAVRYQASGTPRHNALCHCSDCRRSAGAPLVGWAMFAADEIKLVRGEPKIYASSENGRRHFCPECGTGLFYTNETVFPGMIDIQSGTLDDPDAVGSPSAQIQVAERICWMKDAHALPEFERYPTA